jgi:quinohemoprotein ethanol dehydrogenase
MLVLALFCSACQKREPAAAAPAAGKFAQVDATRIVQADQDPGNWLSHGRTYSEQRYSPLAKIDAGNVRQLGLA